MEGYRVYGVGLAADRRFRIPLWRDPGAAELTLRRRAGEAAEPRAAELAYASPLRTPAGDAVATLHRERDAERLSFAAGAAFWMRDAEIEYRAQTSEGEQLLEVLFLGAVMAYWLEKRSCLALHASAVEVQERAVTFLAAHGGGKTSLAAAFLAAGHRLLTDDLLAVDSTPAGPHARAGTPGMRMAPVVAASLGCDVSSLERVHPRLEKRLVPVGAVPRVTGPVARGPVARGPVAKGPVARGPVAKGPVAKGPVVSGPLAARPVGKGSGGSGSGESGFGGFQPRSLPLRAIYLPRRGAAAGSVRIDRVGGAEALKELIRCSWSPYIVEATGLQPGRLERLGRLVEATPVRRLEYPAGLDRLAEVREAVLADLPG